MLYVLRDQKHVLIWVLQQVLPTQTPETCSNEGFATIPQ